MTATPTIVNACLRDGRGGSPTAVLRETPMTDAERRRIPVTAKASHAVFVADDGTVRFFTAEGELPACGHGTVAALAWLGDFDGTLRTRDREFAARAIRRGEHVETAFDAGRVDLREPADGELDVVAALGGEATQGARVASIGRPRLLVPVGSREELAALTPDLDRLRDACDRNGLLGCYVYSPPVEGRAAARMFAPSIGVPEDIANANSTACLAAHLGTAVAVDMGDSLGSPATITARPVGGRVELGGGARI
ncbi:PhzF family phenazine biosynthesis protein [Phytomonospora endophytica]|uniref:PhzF family phenazine biosynthesis protein n=1 Tax=Phytomonospora endophytica TaxID=714109 RepID=A0A841FZE6_9ACTN|nr:PhzF family phenazine biosynthesis protein [Phytomonospora endophytica]MBB6037310.1 PhzF family phenazine biosynthesis protein [Phytomonospora endophytica]GIG69946.1 hypothetical protein Pen01_62410 [Phytomonospora endophytica]